MYANVQAIQPNDWINTHAINPKYVSRSNGVLKLEKKNHFNFFLRVEKRY